MLWGLLLCKNIFIMFNLGHKHLEPVFKVECNPAFCLTVIYAIDFMEENDWSEG